MSGVLAKALGALAGVVLVAALAAVVLVPRALESDTARERIQAEARSLLGARLDWDGMEARLRPLSVSLRAPVLALDPSGGTPQSALRLRWTAPAVVARLALGPLLRGRLEIEALESSDGTLVVRDRWGARSLDGRLVGLEWRAQPTPGAPIEVRLAGRWPAAGDFEIRGELDRGDDGGFALRAHEIGLRAAGLEVHGSGTLRVRSDAEGRLVFDAALDLGPGGDVAIEGERDVAGTYRVRARLDDLDLAPVAVWLRGGDLEVAGRATGGVALSGDVASQDRARIDVVITDARFRVPDVVATGDLPVDATIDRPFSGRPRGRLELDLTAATVEYRGGLRKPAGLAATLDTTFSPGRSGKLVFESRVALRDLDQILTPELLRRFTR
jgi:hypothetical protein